MEPNTYTVELRVECPQSFASNVGAWIGLTPIQARALRQQPVEAEPRILLSFGSISEPGVLSEWPTLEQAFQSILNIVGDRKAEIQLCRGRGDVYWWCANYQKSFDAATNMSSGLLSSLANMEVPVVLFNYHSS